MNDYMDQALDDAVLEKINGLDLDTRVEIAEMHTESAVKYYLNSSLVTGEGGILTVDDIEKYVEIYGEDPLYFMNDEGGYYDNDENKHHNSSVYWGSGGLTSGEYARSYFTYRGDFAVMETYGMRDTGTEEGMTNDYEVGILFKGEKLPYRSEILKPLACVCSNGYLFIPEDERVYVYN